MIAAMAVLAGVAIVVPVLGTLPQRFFGGDSSAATGPTSSATSSAPPGPAIAPLQVRPVLNAEGIAPELCPPVVPVAPTAEMQTCDFGKTGLYTLGPEGAALQLTRVDSLLSPITNGYLVQVAMTPESTQAFYTFTTAQIGKKVAFVRAGVVVSAPEIQEPINGSTLQLSGDLTADQSTEMARLLRDET